jgi:hypothetical protein
MMPATKHLIVSRFNEGLEWMEKLPVNEFDKIFIYNKGKDDLEIKRGDCCYEIIKLENIGKCDHTYLYHILTHYDDLGDINVFLPGTADDPVKMFNTILTMTVALCTHNSMFVCHKHAEGIRQAFFNFLMDDYETRDSRNRDLEPSKSTQPSPIRPFGLWYLMNFGDLHVEHVSYFGIFAVSKKHIRQRSFDKYVHLYKYLNTHKNPEVGHYFERSWHAIFDPIPKDCVYCTPDNKFLNMTDIMTEPTYTLEDLKKIIGL